MIATGAEQAAHFRNASSWRRWLVRRIRNQCSAEQPRAVGGGKLAAIATLSEPARSAYALFQTASQDTDELAELLELRPAALAHAVTRAREALAPGVRFPADSRASLHRCWQEDNRTVERAVTKARQNPKEAPFLAAQEGFDGPLHAEIEEIAPPGDLYLPEFKPPPPPALRSLLRQPAMLALVIALVVVLGVLVAFALHQIDEFPGRDWAMELVETSLGGAGAEFEPIPLKPTGTLADWFLLKGYDNFAVPPELENAMAVGCRFSRFQGVPIAQVALKERDSVLFVFPETRPRLTEDSPRWNFYQHDSWAVAVRGTEKNGYILAFPGQVAEMGDFLHQLRDSTVPQEEAADAAPPASSAPPQEPTPAPVEETAPPAQAPVEAPAPAEADASPTPATPEVAPAPEPMAP